MLKFSRQEMRKIRFFVKKGRVIRCYRRKGGGLKVVT
jgi:hypothetical protein